MGVAIDAARWSWLETVEKREMPKKKKSGKKGKKKEKAQSVDEKLEMVKKTKELLKLYTITCANLDSSTGVYIVKNLKQCIEDEKPLFKVST